MLAIDGYGGLSPGLFHTNTHVKQSSRSCSITKKSLFQSYKFTREGPIIVTLFTVQPIPLCTMYYKKYDLILESAPQLFNNICHTFSNIYNCHNRLAAPNFTCTMQLISFIGSFPEEDHQVLERFLWRKGKGVVVFWLVEQISVTGFIKK